MTLQQTIIVLIIDDDEDDRFFMELAFRTDSPYTQLRLASGGKQALNLLKTVQPLPDVILLDLNMPGMNGFDVLVQLKESTAYRSIPVVILTTSNDSTDRGRAHQLGATEFITKPTTYTELSAVAERIRMMLAQ
jgi:CheY-like chemotaxis protein